MSKFHWAVVAGCWLMAVVIAVVTDATWNQSTLLHKMRWGISDSVASASFPGAARNQPSPDGAPGYQAIQPYRLLDTREGHDAHQRFEAGNTYGLHTTTVPGIPDGSVAAVTMTITVLDPDMSGYLTAWSGAGPRPIASTLTYDAGKTVSNTVTVPLHADHSFSLYSHSGSDVLVDVLGFHSLDGPFTAINAARVFDSRQADEYVRHTEPTWVDLSEVHSQPLDSIDAAMVMVSVVKPDRSGDIRIWPRGDDEPEGAHVQYSVGETMTYTTLAKVNEDLEIALRPSSDVIMTVDVIGWVQHSNSMNVHNPVVRYRSSPAEGCCDPAGSVRHVVNFPDVDQTRQHAGAIVPVVAWVTVRVVHAATDGYVSVMSSPLRQQQDTAPASSTMVYSPGDTRSAMVPVLLDAAGKFEIYTHTETDLDVTLTGVTTLPSRYATSTVHINPAESDQPLIIDCPGVYSAAPEKHLHMRAMPGYHTAGQQPIVVKNTTTGGETTTSNTSTDPTLISVPLPTEPGTYLVENIRWYRHSGDINQPKYAISTPLVEVKPDTVPGDARYEGSGCNYVISQGSPEYVNPATNVTVTSPESVMLNSDAYLTGFSAETGKPTNTPVSAQLRIHGHALHITLPDMAELHDTYGPLNDDTLTLVVKHRATAEDATEVTNLIPITIAETSRR